MKVYNYKVTDEAELFEWYENKLQGLGNRFLSHLEKRFNKNCGQSFCFCKYRFLDFRRFVLDVFPYKIFNLLEDDIIIITAIIHKSGSQRYWRKKLKKRNIRLI